MRRFGKLFCLLLATLLLVAASFSVHAAEYTYTVRLFTGNCGSIGGEQLVTFEGLHAGDRITFRVEDVQLEPDGKYYVRGIRESGRDNDTVDVPSFVVTGDRDYVVAYGVKGNLVAYTVRYLDAAGNPLLPDATYYGNIGDKPVAAFRYIEGYQPNYYNVTKTLSENAAENILTFTYEKLPVSQRSAQVRQAVGGVVEAAASDAAQAAQPDSSEQETQAQTPDPETSEAGETRAPDRTEASEALPAPQELLDLDMPDGASVKSPTAGKQSGLPALTWVLLGVGTVSLLCLALVLLRASGRRRRK